MAENNRLKIRVSRQWLDLLERLQDHPRRIVIIGGTDTGKSTLAVWLAGKLAENATAALIDADVGQSRVGPPAAVGWRLSHQTEASFHFVGDITPSTRSSALLSGLKRSIDEAEGAGAGYTIVDTTGYISDFQARELKTAKVEIASPCDILVLGDDPDVRRLQKGWQNFDDVTIHRLKTSGEVQHRTTQQRQVYRAQEFSRWLGEVHLRWISLDDRSLTAATTGFDAPPDGGLLVAFIDRHRRGICIGLCRSIDIKERRLAAYAPAEAEDAAGIVFGSVVLTKDGQQVDRLS
ncbi:MAG: Clp1/GlmU family protein [Armatimonadota bacterium]